MKKRFTISIDAMGGDNAPASVVEGVSIAISRYPELDFLLFGNSEVLAPLLTQCRISSSRCEVIHTEEFVKSDDKPSAVVRHGRKTSMWLAIDAVKKGDAVAAVSAGNTGALMIMAKFCLSTMKGIDRPAICTALPNKTSQVVMLDLGANAECDANNLVQFALMGSVYCHALFDVKRPRVGLLNIGSEETKGREEIKEAAAILKNLKDAPFEFKGFAEGTDIFPGEFDVISTDGFSGNIALKTLEGTAKFLMSALKANIKSSWLAKFGILFALPALLKFKRRYDPNLYNGAMLMGLNGITVKSHGGANAKSFANAIGAAYDLARHDVISRIRSELELVRPLTPEIAPKAAENSTSAQPVKG